MYSGRSTRFNRSSNTRPSRGFGKRYPSGENAKFRQKFWSVSELERVVNETSHTTEETKEDVYIPKNTFDTLEINSTLKNNIYAKGYKTLTPIQDKVIPVVINKRDVIGIANTGTGKTAAFLVPLLELVSRDKQKKVLILTPTRELALQIYEEFRDFSRGMQIFTAVVIGGANIERQKRELKTNPSFVIATPGRLKDMLKQKAIRLNEFSIVVLDETDRMVDIGFISDIKYFISLFPDNRQSLFFSATVSDKVKEILNAFVKDPVTISVKHQETAENIEQKIIKVPRGISKTDVLHKLLQNNELSKVMVFGSTKWTVQKISDKLCARGHKAIAIHGNKRQSQRQLALKQFKTNEVRVLLATDVASRGLDINNVSHVINYDMPEDYDAYIHRIGRTGRANKKGVAMTLVES